jgi:signal transduction histidine kinase/ActR/RegA family two-component response regulator
MRLARFGALFWGVLFGPLAPFSAQSERASETEAIEEQLAGAAGTERIELLLELAERGKDEPSEAFARVEEALSLLETHPSVTLEIRARIERSSFFEGRGDYATALAEAQDAQALARSQDREPLLAAACFQVAYVHWRMADHRAALAEVELARALQEAHGPSAALVRSLTLQGAIHQSLSELDLALEHYLAGLQMSAELGDERAMARAHNNIGLVYWDLQRFEEAHAALTRALEVHERLGPKAHLANTLNNLGLVLIELERPREALPYLQRALELDEEADNLYGKAKNLSNIGFAHEKLDEHELARQLHEQALALREQIGDQEGIVRSRGTLAELRVRAGDRVGAIGLFEEALALATEIGARLDEAELLERLAEAREGVGDAAGALAAYRRFRTVEKELGDGESRRRLADLEARYRDAERERELATLATLAESRRTKLRWLYVGSGLLLCCLVALGVLLALRARAQRALAESEQRYRTLFQTSVVPTALVEEETRLVLDLNEAARRVAAGSASASPLSIGDLEPEWLRVALERPFERNVDQAALDECWIDAEGRTRWSEVRSSPVALDGRCCRLVSVRDTTESRAREEDRLREDKLRSLGLMAGGIAHDFNNALTAIVGNVALAKESAPPERLQRLALAEQAALEARGLTGQLLAFAKGGTPRKELTNVGRLLREVVMLASSGSRLKTQVDIAPDLWHARLDRSQFRQVIGNLVVNAQEATPEGGHLLVRAGNFVGDPRSCERGAGPRYVCLEFEDDGVGIPEAVRAHVFDPYFTTKVGGNGLGLATAFAICNNHGGALTFTSNPGRGTTFRVFLPAGAARAVESAQAAAPLLVGTASILVLEDEPLVQEVFRLLLERRGFTVEVVSDGRGAVQRHLERLRAGKPFDLLIMDLTIPGGMGGRQAMAEILTHDPRARAIVASGYSDDPTIAHYQEAGFAAALTKPFEASELERVVGSVLQPAPRKASLAHVEPGTAAAGSSAST